MIECMRTISKKDYPSKKNYEVFIKTEEGKLWKKKKEAINMTGNYGDYLYDFYPEYLQ